MSCTTAGARRVSYWRNMTTMNKELKPQDILQLTDGPIGFEPMFTMQGACNPATLQHTDHPADQPLLHRDEEAMCAPFSVQDGFTCSYIYKDETFSFHRHVFFGSLIEGKGIIATEPWYLALTKLSGKLGISGFVERVEDKAALKSDTPATTYISLRVLGSPVAGQVPDDIPKGLGTKVVTIPVKYDASEDIVLGPQLMFKFKRLEGRKLGIDPDFTWSFPAGLWDELPDYNVRIILKVHEAFICEDHDILRSEAS